ncbi:MAG: DUF4382 domain-containing protein [Vicinamibacterales bacterium]
MRVIFAAIVGCTLSALACGGSPSGPSGPGGRFSLMLKDTPFADAKSVLVTFSEVTVHGETESNSTQLQFAASAASRTCDLKKLVTAQDILGIGTLPAGHYTQVRLVVSSATLYFDTAAAGDACAASITAPAGASAPLEIPSGEVKLNRPFDVAAGGATTMLIDFDGDKSISIHPTGNGRFIMRPVITVVSVQEGGTT